LKLFSLPNLLSLGNLLCGCIATLNIVEANFYPAALLVAIACVFDFLDGFAARGLKQGSPMGKELDSLADMVTFGVVPGMVMFQLIKFGMAQHYPVNDYTGPNYTPFVYVIEYLPFVGFIIPLFSGLRLAKFNVDTKQSESFTGLPTLANAIFIIGIPLALGLTQFVFLSKGEKIWDPVNSPEQLLGQSGYLGGQGITMPGVPGTLWDTGAQAPEFEAKLFWNCTNPWLLTLVSIFMSALLLIPFPMFSFKVKNVKWKGNETRYVFLLLSIAMLVMFRLRAFPLIIFLYIFLSRIDSFLRRPRKHSEQAEE
jgi:CDP-diacylglycerol---serine O-phosphatidyltransferase